MVGTLEEYTGDWYTVNMHKSNRTHIVALSGGKDSTAMALALVKREPRHYTFVCTPTGNELPELLEHWSRLEGILGQPIVRLEGLGLMSLIAQQKMIPNHAARWCTRIIKLERYYQWLAQQGPAVSYVGLRADEEKRGGMMFPDTDTVSMDFPLRRWGWGIEEVQGFLADQGITIPDRTDCALCFWQKIGEWYLLWRDHRDLFDQGIAAEAYISKTAGRKVTFRSPQRDSWPASLADLAARFEAGEVPTKSLKMMDSRRMTGACRACTL